MRFLRTGLAFVAVLAVSGGLVGCSGSGSSPARPAGASGSSAGGAGSDPVYDFPLESYRMSTEERSAGLGATSILVNKCAARYGISLDLKPDVELHSDFSLTYYNDLRPITESSARSNGYHLPRTKPLAATAGLADLTPRESEVVSGWSPFLTHGLPKPRDRFLLTGGCAGEAARQLDGPAAPADPARSPQNVDSNVVLGLIQQSTQRAESDPAFGAKVNAWSSCMAKKGYSGFTTLTAAITAFDLNKPVTTAEINQAVADATCKQQVRLLRVWVDLVRRNQETLLTKNQGQLDLIRTRITMRLAKASKVLGR